MSISQEIVNALILETRKEDPETGLKSGFYRADDLIDDNGRFYMQIDRCSPNFHIVYAEYFDIDPIKEFSFYEGALPSRGTVILEYTPGEGITDNTIINYRSDIEISIDGDLIATAHSAVALSYDNTIYDGDTIVGDITNKYISVYDKRNDTLLYNVILDFDSWYETALELDGDYLYVGTTFQFDGLVMFGDTLHHLVDDFIQFTTVLQKVNWRTGELLWTRYTGSLEREDTVRKIKVLDDGTVMVEVEVSGPFSYEGVELDPSNYGNLELEFYNLVFAKFTSDGDYINHVHLRNVGDNAFKYTEIEDDGSFYVSGIDVSSNGIYVGEQQIEIFEDKLSTGLLFSFDNEMNLKWHKTYYSNSDDINDGISIAFGANRVYNGETLCAILHLDTTYVDGVLYLNEYSQFGKSQSLIVHYDSEGKILSEPIPFGVFDKIYDFQQLGDDHYLIFVECRGYPNIPYKPNLFGYELEDPNQPYNMILEVKGDIFESITSVNNLLTASDLEVYPNPCRRGQEVTIKMNEELRSANDKLMTIYDYRGQVEYTEIISVRGDIIVPTTSLTSGPKIVSIATEKNTFSQSIIIL
ncbi:MAG: hypothetical protein ACJATI_004351 [Halioglobus sp.]|jgi:hypothetical protein